MATWSQTIDAGVNEFTSKYWIGGMFETGHVLIGTTLSKCSFTLSKLSGTITGNRNAQLYKYDGTLKGSSAMVDMSILEATPADIEFDSWTAEGGEDLVIRDTDCLVFYGEAIGANCQAHQSEEAVTDCQIIQSYSPWSPLTNASTMATMTVTYGGAPTPSGGTRLPPPPIVLGGL